MNDWDGLDEFTRLEGVARNGVYYREGARVRLKPKPGADILDLVLAGRIGIIESVEQDFENVIHLAVVLEDDPGRDLGMMRQPGHRFFFGLDEVELVGEGE